MVAEPNARALLRLVQQMQSCMVRYLEPGASYTNHLGTDFHGFDKAPLFIDDIIYLLDCPEMIEAMGLASSADPS